MIDTGDGVVLVDWESSAVDGVAVATGVRAVRTVSTDPDATGLARLAVTLLTPLSPLLDHAPGLEEELVAASDADLAAGGRLTGLPPGRRPPTGVRRLAAGIAAAATPDRTDRLFPGDIAQLASPAAALGLLHGATGVLLALAAGGVASAEEWTDWVVRAAHRVDPALRGVGDGLDGIALALLRLGRVDDAARLARALQPGASARPPTRAPWWATGRAGMAAVAAELARALDDEGMTRVVEQHVALTLAAVDAGTDPPGRVPGLLHGWAGVALGLLRVADLTRDGGLRTACCDGGPASRRPRADRRRGRRSAAWSPATGGGCCPTSAAAARPWVTPQRCWCGAAPSGCPPPTTSWRTSSTRWPRRCAAPWSSGAGCCTGGPATCSSWTCWRRATPPSTLHRQRLGWHVVPGPAVPGADVALGEHALRCSTDLATGSAGLLVAHLGGDPLSAVLPLPQAPWAAATPAVTRNT